jgi:hypothetical protein
MAAATVTLKLYPFPQGIDNTQRRVHISGVAAIAASPSTYTTGGLPTNFQAITNVLTGATDFLNTNQAVPIMAYFTSINGSGYVYGWNKATNKLQIFTGGAAQSPMTELTGGATIPAAVSSDVIEFDASFVRASL